MEFKGTVIKASDTTTDITLSVEEIDGSPYIHFHWGHLNCHFGGREELRNFANEILRVVEHHHHPELETLPD